MTVNQVKCSLSSIISELSKTPWLFLRNPAKDFTRKRKLCFRDVVFLLLSMEAKSTANEWMYNFAERITACVVIRRGSKKHAYQANFSAAVHICREFLRGNVHPPDVEALLARFIAPVRPGRKRTRKLTSKGFVGFLYRVA